MADPKGEEEELRISEAPLLTQWGALQEQVVPRLDRSSGDASAPKVWADGDVGDAVAVAVAYDAGRPGAGRPLQAYATAGAGEPPVARYSMADIRSVPVGVRRSGFRRVADGWIPAESVAERIFLGLPSTPVDLVVLRGHGGGPESLRAYSSLLRPDGHILVLGDIPPGLAEDVGLEPVRGTDLLRRRASAPGQQPPLDAVLSSDTEQAEVRTLAQKLLEEELVSRHLNLARGLARRFSGHGEPVDDLRQVAFVGLLLAARRYDPCQNASFSTYATATILGELKRYFRDKSWMMRVPRHVQETYLAIKTAREELGQELACSPTIGQIAARLRITDEAVLEAIEAGDNFLPQSLDSGPDEESPGREVPVIDPAFDVMLERTLLLEAIPRLSEREQLVLKRVYLDGWTQRKVAQEIGVSQMQVSRLLHASAQKIRSYTGS